MASVLHIAASLLALGLSAGQRNVMVPRGPLIRAKGYNISIWCKVSGYQGPSIQTFHWSMYFPSAPQKEVQIVSTEGPGFAYYVYEQRVKSGGIFVERITGDHVLLHITDLQANDAGDYECHTPNTDPSYLGNYSAKVDLLVIPDTLNVIMIPQTLKKVEGDRLELICTVSKSTSQHTHLSVTWHLSSGGDSTELLSLSKDFVLSSGSSYRHRFASGDLRMDKTGTTIYKMTITKLQLSDQGAIYCEAIEWIQDPDGSWKDITKKKSEVTLLTVESLGRNFTTSIKTGKNPLVMGDSLDVTCSVQAQNLPGRLFHVSWLLEGTEVAVMDPHGVTTLQKEYGGRASLGQLQLVRKSLEDYNLWLLHATPDDGGTYSCEVSEVERDTSGSLMFIQSKRSADISVQVAPAGTENNLEVSIKSNKSLVMEGQSVVFHCNTSGTTNPVSVTWYHIREQEHTKQIARLERDGSLRVGPSYQGRRTHGTLRLEKTGPASFELGLDYALMNDSGLYGCQVKEWSQAADGRWEALGEKHQEVSLNVTSLGTGLGATLQSRTHTVQLGDTIVLMCLISAPVESPLSITWQVLPPGATDDSFRPMVRVLHGGGVEWLGQYFQEKGTVTGTATTSKLTLRRVSWKDATSYRCKVEALKRSPEKTWVPAAMSRSNRLTIEVTPKKSLLELDTTNRHIKIGPTTDTFEVECGLTQVQDGSRYYVTWYQLPPSNKVQPTRLLSTDLDGVVQYSLEVDSLERKHHTERVSKTMYKLHVRRVDHSDQGAYYCGVEEWSWPADDGWISLGRCESGKTTVEFQHSESNLQLMKANNTLVTTESEEVTMNCGLEGSTRPDSRLSVTWFYKRGPARPRTLLKMGPNILVDYPDKEKRQRIRFDTPSAGNYSLTLQALEEEDGGLYYCQVEEWLLNPTGSWIKEGADLSGFTHLIVRRPANNLRMNTTEMDLIVLEEDHSSLILPCEITSRSSPSSVFSVAWWKVSDKGEQLVFKVGQDLLFQFGNISNHGSDKKMDSKLRFERPSEMFYHLTVMRPEASESGIYFCRVEEWLWSPAQTLYKISEKRSGNFNITIQQPTETTISSSSVCSSAFPVTYILIFAIIIVVLLVIITVVLWMKLRRSDHQRFNLKGKNLWMAPGEPVRSIGVRSKSDDDGGEEEEGKSVF
ncbi:immunoglobulin superfamily member 3-like [Pleurodeles waltl]|uniref:immunoglobulin superfamily member 3-like n=1 Tax=Pleurodeles waltl TaxID=8319 RepID=UPI003709747C